MDMQKGKNSPAAPRYRHENKYAVDAKQESILRIRAMGMIQPDAHVGADGSYLVRSVYFDDLSNSCFYENEDGTDPRSKFRIRYYNSDTSRLMLEKKSKRAGLCCKEACAITRQECEAFLRGEVPLAADTMPEEKLRLFTEIQTRGLMAKVIVTYERVPFVCPVGNVRVTFDRSITASRQLERFLCADYSQRPVLPCGQSILEVKWDDCLPDYIREALQIGGLPRIAFSKYSMCRRFAL